MGQALFTHQEHRAMLRRRAWIVHDIPRELMKWPKIAAAVEGKTIKALILEALHDKIQEME